MLLQFEVERRFELVRLSLVLLLLAVGEADISDRKIIREAVEGIFLNSLLKTHFEHLICDRKSFCPRILC